MVKKYIIVIIITIAVLALGRIGYDTYIAKSVVVDENTTQTNTIQKIMDQFPGLKIEDTKVGTGPVTKKGDTISVHYVGTLTNGTKFDSSRDRNQPFEFTLGAGGVIKGWEEGLIGMNVGGMRKLTIPPEFGYGARANGPIPASSTLIFEVELLGIK